MLHTPCHDKGMAMPQRHIRGQSAEVQRAPVPLVPGVPEQLLQPPPYPAGIVTTGGAPLSPVSTRVKTNMRKLNSALDGRSRSSIQYQWPR